MQYTEWVLLAADLDVNTDLQAEFLKKLQKRLSHNYFYVLSKRKSKLNVAQKIKFF